ncbi:MAG TPA: hypothetical protein VH325_04420 [Bryobacteraceae bacterium]|nr:hypothetical protein [Bryobacteraceae bacterium]
MRDVWNENFERQSTLTKFQIALALAHVDGFDTGKEPYQSVNALIVLRNAIVHPKTIFGDKVEEQRLLKCLRGKFTFREPKSRNHALFPDSILTSECAAWALVAVLRFLNNFNQKLPPSARLITLDFKTRLAEAEHFQLQRSSEKTPFA